MLDHLQASDQIEALAGYRLNPARAIVDREATGSGVVARHRNVFGRGIDRGDGGAETLQRLRQQPGAATNIERGLAGERGEALGIKIEMPVGLFANVAQAHRIEAVKHRRRAARIPPILRHGAEMRRLACDNAGVSAGLSSFSCYSCVGHGPLLSGAPVFPKHRKVFPWPASS